MAKMDERLEKMVERYREINDLMMQSDVVSDRKTMATRKMPQRFPIGITSNPSV